MSIELAPTISGAPVRRWKRYPVYKESGVEWLGEVPEEWEVRKLKHIASVKFSSVDKKTEEGELPVCLCNYVDVYYNDYITSDLDLMKATASVAEIQNFTLRGGDILITKDSESWDDIAVPSYVSSDFNDVLCGYHLAQIRPNISLSDGEYLFRSFCARGINDQFRVAATGVTRYGLGKYWLDNSLFLVPPLPEQRAIAAFLDRETGRINTLIKKKERQIELLQEKRAALISHAVTKGMDPDVKMKDSGVEWIGRVPERWTVKRLKFLFQFLDNYRIPVSGEDRAAMAKIFPYYGASGIIDYVDDYIFDETLILVAEDGANLLSRSTPLAFIATGKYWVNNHAHILRPINGQLLFWEGVLQTYDYSPLITGAAQPKLTKENLGSILLPCPPIDEQKVISAFLDSETGHIDTLTTKIRESISKLHEYRKALISAAVTGKIDVRQEVMA